MPLVLRDISMSFGDKKIFNNFSFDANDGERICILGPSGGGKTTLLNIIAGLIQPDSGKINCSYNRISYVFQEYRLLPWATALENITAIGCSAERAEELLNAVELDNDMHSYPDSLSGGMKQRVNIARALAYDSDLILFDEPFKELDLNLKERIIDVVSRYCQGRTVILVTHDRRDCQLMECTKIYEFN